MKYLVRMIGFPALVAFGAIWLWAGVAGLADVLGLGGALLVLPVLLVFRCFLLLQMATLVGALFVWHLPLLLALFLAAPRIFLMLPGIISSYLASRRHPRLRWSLYGGLKDDSLNRV